MPVTKAQFIANLATLDTVTTSPKVREVVQKLRASGKRTSAQVDAAMAIAMNSNKSDFERIRALLEVASQVPRK